ncbi:MAG: dockerin type I repeat-containing protein, partial [Oscillospiraceae bacterium]|nr:dockerin type I repeat-containing protein [Oscillospiraceae bacterium]
DWNATVLTLTNSKDVTFTLYKRICKQGETITLGTNGQSSGCVNYAVFAVDASQPDSSDETTAPEQITGDVDLDGNLKVLDVILYQKVLLNREKFTAEQSAMADLNADGRQDAFDLAHLKRLLITKP